MKGVYCTLHDLLLQQMAARQLPLFKRGRARARLAGQHTAWHKGRGIEFEEVRGYQPGDDIRTIDWRVTARSGRTHTKVFREEREKPVFLLVDQSQNMFFGSHTRFKSVAAAEIAALLAWATLNHGDRVGGIVFNQDQVREIRPRRNRSNVLQLLHEIHSRNSELTAAPTQQQQTAPLIQALRQTRRLATPGSAVFIISDLADYDTQTERQLAQLSRHSEVVVLKTNDPLELSLPPAGIYTVTDGQNRSRLDSRDRERRILFEKTVQEKEQSLQQSLASHNITCLAIDSSAPLLEQLQLGLGLKSGRNRQS
ncbi:DUF58 domain-containing protein [Spongorhabdus nitratireducens]